MNHPTKAMSKISHDRTKAHEEKQKEIQIDERIQKKSEKLRVFERM
jgi:hypothetical protein